MTEQYPRTKPGAGPVFDRTRYFPRMIVSPEDLTRDQDYHIQKRRYWTKILHGWGIVRGLELQEVDGDDASTQLKVTRGDAVSRDGTEITLGRDAVIDLRNEDGDGNALILDGDFPTSAGSSTAARRDPGRTYLVAIRQSAVPLRQVRAPLGPKADGSTSEATVLRDAYAFRLFLADNPTLEGLSSKADELAKKGWVVLGEVTSFDQEGEAVDTISRQDFPLDAGESPVDPPGEPGDVIAALIGGSPERAEKHLDQWKLGIKHGLKLLLKPSGISRLSEIKSVEDLKRIPAKLLVDCPDDPAGAGNLHRFYDRVHSPYEESSQITLYCLARLTRDEFAERVREIFRRTEISDRVIRHAHRAAALVYALVKHWPAPTFRELSS